MTFESPAFGQGLCPHCMAVFDLAHATPTFCESHGQDLLIYVMCPSCAIRFSVPNAQKRMGNICFTNVKLHQLNPDGSRRPWAVTTLFSLRINKGNLVDAIEQGAGLPRKLYQGLIDGTHTLAVFPWGLNIIHEV